MRLIPILIGLFASVLNASEWKIAALHPLLADMSRQIGGEHVEVIDLIGPDGDPHHFEPSPEDLKEAADARLFLASGMGLESYLPELRRNLPAGTRLVEVGASLPAIEGKCDHPDHDHGHHDHGSDPHWWHSIETYKRAVTETARVFAEVDPENAATYQSRALEYRSELDRLERQVRRDLARIPREKRVLATAHDAFAYFCRDFGFEAVPVAGINREQMPDARSLAKLVAELRENEVPVIFPESASNPKILKALTADTGIRLGEPLIADGTGIESYEAMIRHNVSTIAAALK